MITSKEALDHVLSESRPLPPRRVPLFEARGRVLAEAVEPDRPYPPFRRAMMDGYAIQLASAGQRIRVLCTFGAGQTGDVVVTADASVELMTGAVCPPGTEAVVKREQIQREGDWVRLPREVRLGQNIAEIGTDCAPGEVLLRPGDTVTPLALGVLASFGRRELTVVPNPRLGIIATGEELVTRDEALSPGRIRDSNGPMLAALALSLGLERYVRQTVRDDAGAIEAAIEAMFDRDLVVLSGGVSAGDFDLVPGVLSNLGAEVIFHEVSQKPGKPLLFARRGPQLIFGLPGNPLATHVCFCRYVATAVRGLWDQPAAPQEHRGRTRQPIRAKAGRTVFVPARATFYRDDEHDGWQLDPLPWTSSADIFHAHQANAYIEVPLGTTSIAAGERVAFMLIDPAGS